MRSGNELSDTYQIIRKLGEGGWIHYRVTDREQLEDAKLLLRVKLGCLASGAQRRGRK